MKNHEFGISDDHIILQNRYSASMELHGTFLRIACPVCGCEMSATDMKSNGCTDDGMFEQYRCGCGAWFTVTVEIDQ